MMDSGFHLLINIASLVNDGPLRDLRVGIDDTGFMNEFCQPSI